MHILTFGGKSNLDFGVIISGEDTWVKPAPKVERISVPGRNGDILLPSGAYENVVITYRCGIRRDFDTNYTALMNYLLTLRGYQRLEDSYHPDVYRMAALVAVEPPAVGPRYRSGEFSLSFDCKPQCWLKTGESVIAIDDPDYDVTLYNPTPFDAKPLLRVYGGPGRVWLGAGVYVNYDAGSGYIEIDSETEDAYSGTTSMTQYLQLEDDMFPVIHPGAQTATINVGSTSAGYIDRLEIIPRWWRL